ncbi:probable BOI-related E3 ubiquitin-protein ligase 2 [Helianthus annuus]|nr:probable BOI-related E3 ubiquitin-protein ligase 2 [Helianthus annuus]
MAMLPPGSPGMGQQMFYSQAQPTFIPPQPGFGYGSVFFASIVTFSLFFSHVEDKFIERLREKEAMVENINKKNMELEMQVEELAMKAVTWQQRAKYNENMINTPKYNLQQVYAQGKDSKEGCGDSEVDDTASWCNGRAHLLCKGTNGAMTCMVCRVNEVCMLLLPCKHLCLCKECESKLGMCPLCQCSKYIGME